MIILAGLTDIIQVITGGAQAVNVHASYVDYNGTTVTPTRANASIASATTTTIVGSPASGVERTAKFLSLQNTDATTSVAVKLQHYDGTTTVNLTPAITLPAGWTLTYNDLTGWALLDASGGRAQTDLVGCFLGTTVLTASSGTFFTQGRTSTLFLRGAGGGGGGAGCTSVASAASAGGGGGSGAYIEKAVAVTGNTGYAYTCGAAGTTGTGAGGAGGSSTFVVSGTTYTAPGGSGAPVATAATTLKAYPGGAGGAVATNGDLNSTGDPGKPGVTLVVATPVLASGAGGSSPFGFGGLGLTAVGNGNAAAGFGAGGGGAATGASATRTGGTPKAGCWVVMEYS